MQKLLKEIRACTVCTEYLELGPNPVLAAHPESRIVLIGQAPGTKVHNSGIPWNDASGDSLRKWLNLSSNEFYDTKKIAIIPMGFCYPGKGPSGDLAPRPECAPLWHQRLWNKMKNVQLTPLIGNYAQKYYLNKQAKKNLTENVKYYKEYLPHYFPLPHPSPRNKLWLKKNPWFEQQIIPDLRKRISQILNF